MIHSIAFVEYKLNIHDKNVADGHGNKTKNCFQIFQFQIETISRYKWCIKTTSWKEIGTICFCTM
jgi:hypothetical protein